MRPHLIPTLTLAALLLTGATAAAQDATAEVELKPPQARQGYYIGGGLASMFNQNLRTEEEDTPTTSGGGGYLRFGQMIDDWIGAGFWIGGGGTGDERYSSGFGGLMLDLQLVPWDHLAVHLGIGAGGLSLTDSESDSDELMGTGGGYYMLGLSYDWFPFYEGGSGGFSVTPTVQLQYLPGQIFDGFVGVVGVELLWWTGLEKNKLDLSVEEAYTREE